MSPWLDWLDWLVLLKDQVVADLDAQNHRRSIKTHTALDGLPSDARVIHRRWSTPARRYRLVRRLFQHLTDAWNHKSEPNVMLVHYADLPHDLRGEMRRIADGLGIDVSDERLGDLAEAATFESMQSDGDRMACDEECEQHERAGEHQYEPDRARAVPEGPHARDECCALGWCPIPDQQARPQERDLARRSNRDHGAPRGALRLGGIKTSNGGVAEVGQQEDHRCGRHRFPGPEIVGERVRPDGTAHDGDRRCEHDCLRRGATDAIEAGLPWRRPEVRNGHDRSCADHHVTRNE